jgi:hypothetical protein
VDSASGISDFAVALSGTGTEPTVTNIVSTPGSSTTTTITKTVTCTITITHKWVTVKVHRRKKREYRKITTRSKGCPRPPAKKAAKPSRKHGKKNSRKHAKKRKPRAL